MDLTSAEVTSAIIAMMNTSDPTTDPPDEDNLSTLTLEARLPIAIAQAYIEFSKHALAITNKSELLTSNEASAESESGIQEATVKFIGDDESRGPMRTFCFFNLPLEVRQMVYEYIPIPRSKTMEPRGGVSELFKVQYEDFTTKPKDRRIIAARLQEERKALKTQNIFCVSKQISREVLPILYGQNLFEIDWFGHGGEACLARLSEDNRRSIRSVCIFATAPQSNVRNTYAPRTLPKDAVWSPMVSKLKKLQIVLDRGNLEDKYSWLFLKDGKLLETKSSDEKTQMWSLWIKRFLEYFTGRLSAGCCVEVDTRGSEHTASVVAECLGSNYVKFDHPWPEKMELTFNERLEHHFR
ncbi:hypothetical protein HYFRA_00008982 [Hymenoscyphus fraxineus]|uniref:DUF7730 domain-containing protein n=1 Tax=Hymenoscyphus fraxineus TaxID=746836 RepID=A0A9N9KU65_9HELO|nr:hypothetical protein HYFRA_00008982 [Hymenoscyphus fraxineus]